MLASFEILFICLRKQSELCSLVLLQTSSEAHAGCHFQDAIAHGSEVEYMTVDIA